MFSHHTRARPRIILPRRDHRLAADRDRNRTAFARHGLRRRVRLE